MSGFLASILSGPPFDSRAVKFKLTRCSRARERTAFAAESPEPGQERREIRIFARKRKGPSGIIPTSFCLSLAGILASDPLVLVIFRRRRHRSTFDLSPFFSSLSMVLLCTLTQSLTYGRSCSHGRCHTYYFRLHTQGEPPHLWWTLYPWWIPYPWRTPYP